MQAALMLSAFKRTGFPEAVTVNMLVERDPTSQANPQALIARPGIDRLISSLGTAPIRLMFQQDGLFDDDALILASDTLYRVSAAGSYTAFTGTVAGDGLCIAAGALDADGNSLVRIATGSAMYTVSGSVVTAEDFPSAGNNVGATSVAQLSGYFMGTEAATDATYYIIPAGTTWGALEFAAAEYRPDPLRGVVVFGETAGLLGYSTTEFWRATGNASSPLEPIGGLKFDIGCRSIHAAKNCNGTLIWVDNNCTVRMSGGGEPEPISDAGLAEQIRAVAAGDLRASFFIKDQHPVYVLTLGTNATWLYDLASKAWTRAASDGYDYWRADMFANIGDVVLCRDSLSNTIYRLDPDLLTDDGDTFTREWCARVEVPAGVLNVGNVQLDAFQGGAPRTGQGSDPLVGMQVCRDGVTYGPLKYRSMGETGNYGKRVRWNGLGILRAPFGGVLKFQLSDPVTTRVSGVRVNDQ